LSLTLLDPPRPETISGHRARRRSGRREPRPAPPPDAGSLLDEAFGGEPG